MDNIVYDLAIEFIAAFLGFLFAIFLNKLSDKKEEKRKYRMILECLNSELEDIVGPLKQYAAAGRVLTSRIAIPTWDALQYSAMALELIDKPYFNELINTYSLIKAYNEDQLYRSETLTTGRLEEIIESAEKSLQYIHSEGEK